MSSERESLMGRQSSPTESASQSASPSSTGAGAGAGALYHDSSQTPRARMCQIFFVSLVVVMVLITISLSMYRGTVMEENGFMYFLLGVNMIGFAVLEIIMIIFVRRGDLPKGKTWFLYFVGGAAIFEAIFTDVALFR